MDFHPVMQTEPYAQFAPLPGEFAQRFLSDSGGLLTKFRRAMRPFKFEPEPAAGGVNLTGDRVAVMLVQNILQDITIDLHDVRDVSAERVDEIIEVNTANMLKRDFAFRFEGVFSPVRPSSLAQVAFMGLLLKKSEKLLIAVGPTGTGKTYLAIAAGINMLAEERIKHLVITRPHVLLEGEVVTATTRQETQYDEQFTAIEDTLESLIGYTAYRDLIAHKKLEIAPLGHLRGRTFNKAMIIIDDAQNMTVQKMRMAVTRLGEDSRLVIAGDPSNIDLRGDDPSGLKHLVNLVQGTDIAEIFRFENNDIIRNKTVARLEQLYSQGNGREAMSA